MAKLYVFGIGGTGSRTLRALSMLLASGVECEFETVVPVIIDPDASAADMTRTVDALTRYMEVRKSLDFNSANDNKFFKTEICPIQDMSSFKLDLENTENVTFRDFMKTNQMNDASRAFISMLFSQANLDSDMVVGFKGNPNIGSVVLNQFSTSEAYKAFSNAFEDGDRVFIISSIFGGTGASGFPLLLKTLRNDKTSQHWTYIQKAKVGAVTVLPYFSVEQDDNSGVDSSTFFSKTKSALAYYDRNISGNGSVDALYYIGDNMPASYKNHDGGTEQKNDAHMVELYAALSILKFASTPDSEMGGHTLTYEYGIDTKDEDIKQVIFKDLGPESRNLIQKPLTMFMLMNKYMKNALSNEFKHQPWAVDCGLDENFFTSQYYQDLVRFQDAYMQWIEELDRNKRSFKPFEQEKVNDLFNIVTGQKASRLFCISKNYALLDSYLNKNWSKWDKSASKEQKFMELFYRATDKLTLKKYNF